jgi:hypothetical protein
MLWLLESDVFAVGPHPLTTAVRRAGHRVLVWRDDWWSVPDELPAPTDERVLFHGSLANAGRIAALGRWDPGAYCATARLSCSAWYPQATRWLANASHVFSTVRELVAEPERVAAPLEPTSGRLRPPSIQGRLRPASPAFASGRVFVRPDGCLKPFSGRVVALAGLTPGHLDHGFYYDDLDLPIVIAPVQTLGREWRFVAAGVVVASSAYEAVGRRADESAVPSEAR